MQIKYLIFGIIIFIVLVFVIIRGVERQWIPNYIGSSYSTSPAGHKAIYDHLTKLGFNTRKLTNQLISIPSKSVLLVYSDDQYRVQSLTRWEKDNLNKWIKNGGILFNLGVMNFLPSPIPVVLSESYIDNSGQPDITYLIDYQDEGLIVDLYFYDPDLKAGQPVWGGNIDLYSIYWANPLYYINPDLRDGNYAVPYEYRNYSDENTRVAYGTGVEEPLVGLNKIKFEKCLKINTDEKAKTLIEEEDKKYPLAIIYPYGKGQIVVFASGYIFNNNNLAKNGNSLILPKLLKQLKIRNEPIIFDEYHIGVGSEAGLLSYFTDRLPGVILIQIVLLLLFVFWYLKKRWFVYKNEENLDEVESRFQPSYLWNLSKAIEQIDVTPSFVDEIIETYLKEIKESQRNINIDKIKEQIELKKNELLQKDLNKKELTSFVNFLESILTRKMQ